MRITCDSTTGIIIDVQDRLVPVMHQPEETLKEITTLIRGLGVLNVPMLITEQYPKGLGPTVPAVQEAFSGMQESGTGTFTPIVKSAFSCCDDTPFSDRLAAISRDRGSTVLIAGIETHVCVLQTTIDLIGKGYTPVVVTDATSSRSPWDRDIAFRRLEREGALLTTVESVLFELTRISGTTQFKEISRLIK